MIQPPPNLPAEGTVTLKNAREYLGRMTTWAHESLQNCIQRRTAVSEIYLQAPGGLVYSLSVDDSGSLVTTLITPGGDSPDRLDLRRRAPRAVFARIG